MKKILNNILAFCGGMLCAGLLILFWFFFKNPFYPTHWGKFLAYLIIAAFIEEGLKFLFIKRNIGRWPYGFTLGLGFGIGETLLRYPIWEVGFLPIQRTPAIIAHIIYGGVLSYYVRKDRPAFGLILAILLHTLFDVLVGGL